MPIPVTDDTYEAIDISRLSDGIMLPPEVSAVIHADTLENSAVQSLATQIEMPAAGVEWQTITGEPEAAWVHETEEKPVSRPTFGQDRVRPYKMAVIVPFSDEFKRDKARLFAEVKRRFPYALGRLFDSTALGLTAAPGEYFDSLADVPEVVYDPADAYGSLLDVDEEVSANGHLIDGWALAPRARNTLMRAKDANGNPLMVNGVQDGDIYGTLLGGRVEYRKVLGTVPNLMGIAGDFSRAQWGTVEGVRLSAATEATLTDSDGSVINLWQRNMFALRAEIEVAFKADETAFARLVSEATPADAGTGDGDDDA